MTISAYSTSPRCFISSTFISTPIELIKELPQLKKMFSKRFNFVILTVIFLLLQGTFSVVCNMHLYFMCFQTRSDFRAENLTS
jgi:hypothetical protein